MRMMCPRIGVTGTGLQCCMALQCSVVFASAAADEADLPPSTAAVRFFLRENEGPGIFALYLSPSYIIHAAAKRQRSV